MHRKRAKLTFHQKIPILGTSREELQYLASQKSASCNTDLTGYVLNRVSHQKQSNKSFPPSVFLVSFGGLPAPHRKLDAHFATRSFLTDSTEATKTPMKFGLFGT